MINNVSSKLFIFFILILSSFVIYATSFRVSPIPVIFLSGQIIGSIDVTNESNQKSIFQIDVLSMDDNDRFHITNDMIIAPKIITVIPKEKQVVRISRRIANNNEIEQHYFVNVHEIGIKDSSRLNNDSEKNKKLLASIHTLLGFMIPLYIEPETQTRTVDVSERKNKDELFIKVNNTGNVRIGIKEILAYADKSKKDDKPIFKTNGGVVYAKKMKEFKLKNDKIKNMKNVKVIINTSWKNSFSSIEKVVSES